MYRVMCQVLGMRACVREGDVVDPRGTPTLEGTLHHVCGMIFSSVWYLKPHTLCVGNKSTRDTVCGP